MEGAYYKRESVLKSIAIKDRGFFYRHSVGRVKEWKYSPMEKEGI